MPQNQQQNQQQQNDRPRNDRPRNKPPKKSPAYRAARRDVRLALQPYLQAIRRARQQGRQEAATADQRYTEIYDVLGQNLAAIGAPSAAANSAAASSAASAIGSLGTGLLGGLGSVPAGERAAGANMLQTIGANTVSDITNLGARNAGFLQSQQAQAEQERAVQQRNIQNELSRYERDLSQQRVDILSQAPAMILQRMDERRAQNFDRMIALEQLRLQQAAQGNDTRLLDMQIAQLEQQQALLNDPQFWDLLTGRPRR
jgi:hypothetical protein